MNVRRRRLNAPFYFQNGRILQKWMAVLRPTYCSVQCSLIFLAVKWQWRWWIWEFGSSEQATGPKKKAPFPELINFAPPRKKRERRERERRKQHTALALSLPSEPDRSNCSMVWKAEIWCRWWKKKKTPKGKGEGAEKSTGDTAANQSLSSRSPIRMTGLLSPHEWGEFCRYQMFIVELVVGGKTSESGDPCCFGRGNKFNLSSSSSSSSYLPNKQHKFPPASAAASSPAHRRRSPQQPRGKNVFIANFAPLCGRRDGATGESPVVFWA